MNLLERLTQEHQKLRQSLSAMGEFLHDNECSTVDHLAPSAVERLAKMQKLFHAQLKAHEELEDRFFTEALAATGSAALIKKIHSEHESIEDVFKILSALNNPSCGENFYSLRFAVLSLSFNLTQHLDNEEKEIFPLLRRILSAAQLEEAGARAEKHGYIQTH
jgi:hemerythrin-like domain-containing protein